MVSIILYFNYVTLSQFSFIIVTFSLFEYSGVVACDRCISNKAYLSHYNTQDVVPVCTPCYDRYLNKEKKAYIKDMRETSNSVTIREPSRAELERHLKVRNGAIRQIQRTESSHVNMLNNARLNPVNLCTLCVSEFSMMKSKQTCMNWYVLYMC